MRWLASFFGLLMVMLGALGIVAPDALLGFAAYMLTENGLYFAAAIRIAFGVALIAVADGSRLPNTIRVLGALIVVAGVVTLFFGVERAQAMLDWWSAHGPASTRLLAALPVIFGLFIIYAVAPRRRSS